MLYLTFPENHFDAVHYHSLLMHVPDTMAVLLEIIRVLKTGGILEARESIVEKFIIEPDIGHIEKVLTIFSAVMVANCGYPDMGKELRAKFSDAGLVNVEATAALETWGSPTGIATFAEYVMRLDGTVADQAIAHGIATRDELDALLQAMEVCRRDTPALSPLSSGVSA